MPWSRSRMPIIDLVFYEYDKARTKISGCIRGRPFKEVYGLFVQERRCVALPRREVCRTTWDLLRLVRSGKLNTSSRNCEGLFSELEAEIENRKVEGTILKCSSVLLCWCNLRRNTELQRDSASRPASCWRYIPPPLPNSELMPKTTPIFSDLNCFEVVETRYGWLHLWFCWRLCVSWQKRTDRFEWHGIRWWMRSWMSRR